MFRHDLSPSDIRRLLGIRSRTTVMRYVRGERRPSRLILTRIEALTKGAVTEADFLDPRPANCVRVVLDRAGMAQEVYPWTNLEAVQANRPDNDNQAQHSVIERAYDIGPASVRGGDTRADDLWPSKPIARALEALGPRARVAKRRGFLLDGRLVDAKRIVIAANRVLAASKRPTIPYPGVEAPK